MGDGAQDNGDNGRILNVGKLNTDTFSFYHFITRHEKGSARLCLHRTGIKPYYEKFDVLLTVHLHCLALLLNRMQELELDHLPLALLLPAQLKVLRPLDRRLKGGLRIVSTTTIQL